MQLIVARKRKPRKGTNAGKAITMMKEIGILAGEFDTPPGFLKSGQREKGLILHISMRPES